jgi:hypothetical protein
LRFRSFLLLGDDPITASSFIDLASWTTNYEVVSLADDTVRRALINTRNITNDKLVSLPNVVDSTVQHSPVTCQQTYGQQQAEIVATMRQSRSANTVTFKEAVTEALQEGPMDLEMIHDFIK